MSGSQLQSNSYVWITSPSIPQLSIGEVIGERYQVINSRIWLDLHPEIAPTVPKSLPDQVIPYLWLYPQRLHISEVYGVCEVGESQVVLLNNVPIDNLGNLSPCLDEAWEAATGVRQVYWLWQMLELWQPLVKLGLAQSLLAPANVRVDGWRVRLLELYADRTDEQQDNPVTPSPHPQSSLVPRTHSLTTLHQLGKQWTSLLPTAQAIIAPALEGIVAQMQAPGIDLQTIRYQLNGLLLDVAAQQPLRSSYAGLTDTGIRPKHNEDNCYPNQQDSAAANQSADQLAKHFMIVCDGLGGHEGGEVASQLAVQSLKLQIGALLQEMTENPELSSPDLITEQLTAIIRVTNNLIATRNDAQSRELRRRMGTTLVMALQLPQQIATPNYGMNNSHELYLAHVGDSRAYWLTADRCCRLTVDDDVVTREVRLARSLPYSASQRSDAEALTQALGTRHSDLLRLTVQRLIIEEDGLLLLCSDGLSDNNLLEQCWQEFTSEVLEGKLSLTSAAQFLVERANQINGHDNISLTIAQYGVSQQDPVLVNLSALPASESDESLDIASNLPGSGEVITKPAKLPATAVRSSWRKRLALFFLFILLGIFGVTAGLVTREIINGEGGWEQQWQKWQEKLQYFNQKGE